MTVLLCRLRIFAANAHYYFWGGRNSTISTFKNTFKIPRCLKVLLAVFLMPYAFVRALHLINKPLVIRQISLAITTKCTLNCIKCTALVPYYDGCRKKPYSIPAMEIIASFDALFDALDCVFEMSIVGGEPLLHKELGILLEHFAKQDKLKSFTVITNGTIIPDDSLVHAFKHPKCLVFVSDYGIHSKNIKNLIEWLRKHEINYSVKKDYSWNDIGDLKKKNRSYKELRKLFVSCRAMKCLSFIGSKLHHCSISSYGMDLGLVPDCPTDYVDVALGTTAELRQRITKLRLRTYTVTACDYCDQSFAVNAKSVTPGEQVPA